MPVYNQGVRITCVLALTFCLAACNRGNQSKEAVRQAVVDYVAGRGLNMSGMNVDVTSVQFDGNKATATVAFTPKGGPAGGGMSMQYELEQQSGKWVVVGRKDTGASPHGGGSTPPGQPGANPHGGMEGAAPPGAAGAGGSAMPSPEDLPPVDKKK
jgi:hypothetical protein